MENKVDIDAAQVLFTAASAGSAFLATTYLDSKLSSHPFNDLKLVGQIVTTRPPAWQILGLLSHYGFSVVMTIIYARYGRKLLPGPGWLRGVIFMQLENAVLYPGAALLEPVHAGMKDGQVPTLFSQKSWWGQVVRHVAFGAVMGALVGVKRDS